MVRRRPTEAFSANIFFRSLPAFAACFLEMNEVYWELSLTKVIFMVLSFFYIKVIFMWPRGCS